MRRFALVLAVALSCGSELALAQTQVLNNGYPVQVTSLPTQFQSPLLTSTQTAPRLIVTADMDGDGNQDLVVSDRYASAVQVFYGNGKGGFPTQITLATTQNIQGLTVGDFNGDGLQDIAAGGLTGSVFTWLATGARAYGSPSTIVVSGSPGVRGMAAAKLCPLTSTCNASLILASATRTSLACSLATVTAHS